MPKKNIEEIVEVWASLFFSYYWNFKLLLFLIFPNNNFLLCCCCYYLLLLLLLFSFFSVLLLSTEQRSYVCRTERTFSVHFGLEKQIW